MFLNYADSGERDARADVVHVLVARQYKNAAIGDAEHALLKVPRVRSTLFGMCRRQEKLLPLELDRWFHSPVDIIVMRSAWDDPNALFVGVRVLQPYEPQAS